MSTFEYVQQIEFSTYPPVLIPNKKKFASQCQRVIFLAEAAGRGEKKSVLSIVLAKVPLQKCFSEEDRLHQTSCHHRY